MGKVALGVISFILIITIPLVIAGFAGTSMLYPEAYISAFEKEGIYDKLPQMLSENGGVAGLFTRDFLKSNIDRTLANALAYIRGESNEPDISIAIDRNQIRSLLLARINEIPQCPAGVTPTSQTAPECFPAGFNRAQFADATLNSAEIPDKIDLLDAQPQLKDAMDKFRSGVGIFWSALYGLAALSALLLLLMIFLTRKSAKSMLRWVGSTLAISGATMVATSFVLTGIVTTALKSQLASSESVMSLVAAVMDVFASNMMLYSAAVLVIGLVLVLLSMKMKSPETKKKKS